MELTFASGIMVLLDGMMLINPFLLEGGGIGEYMWLKIAH